MDDCKRLNIVNGVVTDLINIQDRGLQYGDGLFETIAINKGSPVFLELHIERLISGLSRLQFPVIDIENLKRSIVEYSKAFQQAILKLIVTRGPSDRGYAPPVKPTVSTIISITEHKFAESYSDYLVERLAICETLLSENQQLSGIKHLNRLEQVLASHECYINHYSDCVLLNPNGLIIESVSSNIFIWKNQKLFTPNLDLSGIKGVTREKIIELAKEMSIPIEIGPMTINALKTAEAIFLTNSVKPIQPVARFQSVQLDQSNWPVELYQEVMQYVYA